MRKTILLIGLLGLMVLLAGCGKTPTGGAVADMSLQELCQKDGNMFMTMGPVVDGVPTGEPACAGCMVGTGHYCTVDEYLDAVSKQ